MPINVPLVTLLRDLRAETGQSLNVGHHLQTHDSEVYTLNRQQRELANTWDWPHLLTLTPFSLVAGVTQYLYPPAGPFQQINHMWASVDPSATLKSPRKEVTYGIDEANLVQEGLDTPTWPPQRWQNFLVHPATLPLPPPGGGPLLQFRVWPTPSMNGTVWLSGTPEIPDMVTDIDRCWLDSTLIVLFAAAEILANQKSEAASIKFKKADQYLNRLRANGNAVKRRMRALGQGGTTSTGMTPWIDFIPA